MKWALGETRADGMLSEAVTYLLKTQSNMRELLGGRGDDNEIFSFTLHLKVSLCRYIQKGRSLANSDAFRLYDISLPMDNVDVIVATKVKTKYEINLASKKILLCAVHEH